MLDFAGIYPCDSKSPKLDAFANDLRQYVIYEGASSGYRLATDWGKDRFTTHISYPQRVANVTGLLGSLTKRYIASKGMCTSKSKQNKK